jgi:hypothetical protein
MDCNVATERLEKIKVHLKTDSDKISIAKIRVLIANVHWFMQYIISAQTGSLPPSEFLTDPGTNRSVYGYVLKAGRNAFGRAKVDRPNDVCITSLHATESAMKPRPSN